MIAIITLIAKLLATIKVIHLTLIILSYSIVIMIVTSKPIRKLYDIIRQAVESATEALRDY